MKSVAAATIVLLTHNRREQVLRTLEWSSSLPGQWPIIVVDNDSQDGTPAAINDRFPDVLLIPIDQNLGAAARNLGVAYAQTPYIAFSDDDTQWEPGAIERAISILDAYPRIAIVNAHVQVGPHRRPDPACDPMRQSPLTSTNLPGPQLLGFMAGACVMRTSAFLEVGGYWPPFFIGGEETLMALDLAERQWKIVYIEDIITRHFPSKLRNHGQRKLLLLRNAIWTAWLRRPAAVAARETFKQLREASQQKILLPVVTHTLLGLLKVLSRRKVISDQVEAMLRALERPHPALHDTTGGAFR